MKKFLTAVTIGGLASFVPITHVAGAWPCSERPNEPQCATTTSPSSSTSTSTSTSTTSTTLPAVECHLIDVHGNPYLVKVPNGKPCPPSPGKVCPGMNPPMGIPVEKECPTPPTSTAPPTSAVVVPPGTTVVPCPPDTPVRLEDGSCVTTDYGAPTEPVQDATATTVARDLGTLPPTGFGAAEAGWIAFAAVIVGLALVAGSIVDKRRKDRQVNTNKEDHPCQTH